MANLTPRDRERIAELESFSNRVHHARGVVEKFAAQPADSETLSISVRRTFNQLKLQFTTAGLDTLAQICAGLETAARTGSTHQSKSGKLREGVGTLSRLLEQERRLVLAAAGQARPSQAD
jgi:hypothetical protein